MQVPRVRFHPPRPAAAVIDVAVAVVLLALLLWDVRSDVTGPAQTPSSLVTYALAFLICLPYAFHRQAPLAAVGVTSGAVTVYAAAQYGPYPLISTFVLLWGVAAHSDRRRSLICLGVGMTTLALALALQPSGVADTATWVSTLLSGVVAWLAGDNLRQRRSRWAAIQERTRLLEERAELLDREREERARQAVVVERLRIARELHDVVAHSMSVVAVQSGMAHLVLDSRPEEARAALAAIEVTSRSALAEMRRLLGVLRQEGEPHAASLAPAPGLRDVPELVEHVRRTGRVVELTVDGEVGGLPSAVDLTAYRIVQEALTNVIKHGGHEVGVRVSAGDAVEVEVVDSGAGAAWSDPVAGGHGLLGMRERVAVFDGRFEAEHVRDGGFRVWARLPVPQAVR